MGQALHVNTDPHVLHAGQHPDQRHLHVVVEVAQALGIQGRQQGRGQMGNGQGTEAGLHRRIDRIAGVIVEQPPLVGLGGPRQLHGCVGSHQVFQLVPPAGRIKQIGRDPSVQGQSGGIDPLRQQPQDQRFGIVGDEPSALSKERS